MDRLWQWLWDRTGPRYSWAVFAATAVLMPPAFLITSFLIVAVEGADTYVVTALVTIAMSTVFVYLIVLPGLGSARIIERWAAGQADRLEALQASYAWNRRGMLRALCCAVTLPAVQSVAVAAASGVAGMRLVQYAVLGTTVGAAIVVTAAHGFSESYARPARRAITADTGFGGELPRSRPTFATWSNGATLATVYIFSVNGAMLVTALEGQRVEPMLLVAIGFVLMLGAGLPLTVGLGFAPSLRPIRDLTEGTERVALGDYGRSLPAVQDDDLGALAASFNRMQAGLAERQRLQAAFGSYVDPLLAARLIEQGTDVFSGERRNVTVMFVDIREFTPFAEANSAEDTVSRLNALFEIVVPAVVDVGGHVNKYLGDGALAVFGAPNDLADHADAAVTAAVRIQRRVGEQFGDGLRVGIGINTGSVIAGTIGGAGKLEFTLIGDTVNVAARVEQLTKDTGDGILLTQECADALVSRPVGLLDRGNYALKGKSAAIRVFGLVIGPRV